MVVAHAPIELKTVSDRGSNAKWWDSLTGTIRGRKNVILLIDANAHVGSEVSEHVGSGACAEDQNFKGASFHDVLRALRLCVNATFDEFAPQKYTWTCHRTGTHHRNDYIAVPLEWVSDAISSSVLKDVNTGASNVDHYPVTLELESVASACGQGVDPFISRFPLDGAKLTDSACQKVFSDFLESEQAVPWSVDVDTVCQRQCKTL